MSTSGDGPPGPRPAPGRRNSEAAPRLAPRLDDALPERASGTGDDRTQEVTIPVTHSVLTHFRAAGKDYKTRMRRVLENHVHHSAATGTSRAGGAYPLGTTENADRGDPVAPNSGQADEKRPGPAAPPLANAPAPCDICGWDLVSRHCKLRCDRCGYVRDCSDP